MSQQPGSLLLLLLVVSYLTMVTLSAEAAFQGGVL